MRIIALSLAFASSFMAVLAATEPGPSFEERWAPVREIDSGVKGDRVVVKFHIIPEACPILKPRQWCA